MQEVTDQIELGRIRSIVQGTPFFDDPNVQFQLYRAFEDEQGVEVKLYRIEIVVMPQSLVFCGLLSMPDGHIYLDWVGIKTLVREMIQQELDTFNAGKHWRYRGL